MTSLLERVRHWTGLDRAVLFTTLTQVLRFVTGPVTMILIVTHFSPELQGYYYTFGSVVALQVFLELGFSQNILQFASHEFSKLRLVEGKRLEGEPVALSRLGSLARLAFGYYGVAAVLVFGLIGLGGHLFLASGGGHGVNWSGPWWIVAAFTSASLVINPAWSLLEGCNQMAAVAGYRFWLTLGAFLVTSLGIVGQAELYSLALAAATSLVLGVIFLFWGWRDFFWQLLSLPQGESISWSREVWPFQWRIAVSWISGYFIFSLVTPVAFRFAGPVEAGRVGMTFQLVRTVGGVASAWLSTKIPRFGMHVARRDWAGLDSLWRRSTTQTLAVGFAGLLLLFTAIPVAEAVLPGLGGRLAGPGPTAWFSVAVLMNLLVSAMAYELRAFKREPFMAISVLHAALAAGLMIPLTQAWGIGGTAIGYAAATWLAAAPAAYVYWTKRREYRG